MTTFRTIMSELRDIELERVRGELLYINNDAKNRVKQTKEELQTLKDKNVKLEQEIDLLKAENQSLKGTDNIKNLKILFEVEKLQHTRQVHHLRTKTN